MLSIRTVISLVILLTFGSANAETIGPAPKCRLIDQYNTQVSAALTNAFKVLDPDKRIVSTISVNEYLQGDHTINVQIVSDAEYNDVAPEGCSSKAVVGGLPVIPDKFSRSTAAMCAVEFTPGPLMKCSASGIRLLLESEKESNHNSVSLLYILAHEASHVIHHDQSSFAPNIIAINLESDTDGKWSEMRNSCKADTASIASEKRADQDAITVLSKLVPSAAYSDPMLSPAASVAMAVNRLHLTADSLLQRTLSVVKKRRLPRALVDPHLPASGAEVAQRGDRALCELITDRKGQLLMPVAGGTHPDAASRMYAVSNQLDKVARGLSASIPKGGQIVPGNLDALIGDMAGIFTVLDQEEATLWKDFGSYICKNWINPNLRPDCTKVMNTADVIPQEDCRQFQAKLKITPYTEKTSASEAVRVGQNKVVLKENVRFAVPLSEGNLLIGLDTGLAVVDQTGVVGKVYAIPCQPNWAFGSMKEAIVTCGAPGGFIEVRDGKPSNILSIELGLFDDEKVSGDDLAFQWVGSVNGKYMATGSIGLAGSFTFQLDGDQLTFPMPWKSQGCSKISNGHSLWQLKPTNSIIGITWSNRVAVEVAWFTTGFDHLVETASPESPIPLPASSGTEDVEAISNPPIVLGCGPSFQFNKVVCLDDSGSVFTIEAKNTHQKLKQIELSAILQKAQVSNARICGTRTALYILTIAERPDVESQFWRIDKEKGKITKLSKAITDEAGLSCNADSAVSWMRGEAGVMIERFH